jgi:hypothetical protein
MTPKLYKLSDDDIAKLKAVRESAGCESDTDALRLCIRETHKRKVKKATVKG